MVPPIYGDFSMGEVGTMETFAVKTYLFNDNLKERLII